MLYWVERTVHDYMSSTLGARHVEDLRDSVLLIGHAETRGVWRRTVKHGDAQLYIGALGCNTHV